MAFVPADPFFMGVVHRALQLDLARVVEAVWSDPDDDRRVLVARQATYLMDFLHVHHSIEDDHLWPMLRGRSAELDSMVDELDADHRRIEQLVPAVEEAALAYAELPEAGFALVDAIRRLRRVLDGHLWREEAEVLPFAGATLMSADDWAGFSEKSRPTDPALVVQQMAWFLEELDDERTAKIKAMLPPPAWEMIQERGVPARAASRAAWAG